MKSLLAVSVLTVVSSVLCAQVRSEDARLSAPDGSMNDRFGSAAVTDGDRALIGAYAHGGIQDSGGAAYLLARDRGGPGRWGLVKKLAPLDLRPFDMFGIRVALAGDLAVCSNDQGTVYVFERNTGGPDNWGEEKRLSFVFSPYGPALALEGERLVVGSAGSGEVLVFERNLGGARQWGRRARLVDPTPGGAAGFGSTVSLSGSTLFVSRLPLAVGAYVTGTVHVYERDRGGADKWGAVQTIASPEAGVADMFGRASLDGDHAVVGAMVGRSGRGAAYLYARTTSVTSPWQLVRTFTSPQGRLFGRRAELEGDVLAVEEYFDDALQPVRSSVQVFVRNLGGPGAWGALTKLAPAASDVSGLSVASLSGGTLLGTDETADLYAGAAFVFDVARAANHVRNGGGTNLTCYASATPPRLSTVWIGTVDARAHAGALATLLMARERGGAGQFVSAGEILLDLTSPRLFAGVAGVVSGRSSFAMNLPNDPALIGFAFSSQVAILGGGSELCNALDLVLGP